MDREVFLSDDLLRELGVIASTFGTVEYFVDEILWNLAEGVDVEEADAALASLMSFEPVSRRLDRIWTLSQLRLEPPLSENVAHWIERVKNASETRNRVLHALWIEGDPDGAPTMVHRRRRRRSSKPALDELRAVSSRMLDLLELTIEVWDDVGEEIWVAPLFGKLEDEE